MILATMLWQMAAAAQQVAANPALAPVITTAQSVKQIADSAQSTDMVGTQVVASILMAYVFEALKKSPRFKLITVDTPAKVQFYWGLVVAAATSLGVHLAYTWDPVSGHFTIDITGLLFTNVGGHLWDFAKAWVAQQFTHDIALDRRVVVVNAPAPPAQPAQG